MSRTSTQKIKVGVVLAIAITGIVISALAASLLMAYQTIPNAGNVRAVGVGVYWDTGCTSNVTYIDWEFLEHGATKNVTVYIKNEGSTPLVLNLTTNNWSSTLAREHIELTWNREGYVLNTAVPVVQTVLTLSVSSDITEVTDFTFDIVITGTEHA